jgi:hypothetical protein
MYLLPLADTSKGPKVSEQTTWKFLSGIFHFFLYGVCDIFARQQWVQEPMS